MSWGREPILEGPTGHRNCAHHMMGGVYCGKPSVMHIFWNQEWANSFVCAEHREEALRLRHYRQHYKSADCGMPGAKFDPVENRCYYENEELPVAEKEEIHVLAHG